jgi:glycosyltransferase involved in cell wall biosynthesis
MTLRFCFVTTFYPPYHFGGDGICVYRLAEALARRGHRVDVVHSRDAYHLAHPASPEIDFEHHPNVSVHGLHSARPGLTSLVSHQTGRPAGYGPRLRELLEDGEHDVIHYHNISLMGGPGVLGLGDALKLYTAHEYWLVCPTHVLFRYGREACTERTCLRCTLHSRRPPQLWRYTGHIQRCVESVDRFLMPSEFARDQHRAAGIDRPMTVLPHFVPDVGVPAPDVGGRTAEAPYFLYVGRLEKLKGVQDLLPLFRRQPDARLRIVGSGDYRATLERKAAGMENVEFLGQVHPDELARIYRDALAVLVPSLCYEVFNLIPVEAFSHGTPAIVRDLGATPELVTRSRAGFAFRTMDACGDAMNRLASDPALRQTLGERGRDAYEQYWTEETHLQAYLEIVDGMLAERHARRSGP